MATATAEKPRVDPRMVTAKAAGEAGQLNLVDQKRNYSCLLQLGANMRWRGNASGEWKRNVEGDNPLNKTEAWMHVPAIHEIESVPGVIMNGLISEHNRWVAANQQHDRVLGDIGRQLLVSQIKETEVLPGEATYAVLTPKVIEEIATAAARGIMQAAQGGDAKKPPKQS